MSARRVRVLMTDAQELSGLGAVRSLGRAGHHVTAAYVAGAHRGPPASTRSRHCAAALPYPDPWREQPAFRDWLRAAAGSGDYDVILPLSEAAIHAAAVLRREGGRPGPLWLIPPDDALRFALSKHHATRSAQGLGLRTPRTLFISDGEGGPWADPADGDRGIDALGYPLVIKYDNHLGRDGSYRKGGAVTVASRVEADSVLAECRESGAATLAQELVPGHGTGAFLLRHGGQVRLRFAHQRLHEVPWTGGWSSLRRSVHDPAMMAQAEALLAGIGYEGVAMVEFRRDARDGGLRFLEINGRLWGSLALALHAGVDFPRLLLEANLGGDADDGAAAADYPDGLRCRNVFPGEIQYLRSVLRAPAPAAGQPPPPDKLGAVLEFLRLSLDPRVRHDYFWPSDPAPGVWQALGTTASLLTKAAQQGLRRAARETPRARSELGAVRRDVDRRLGALRRSGHIVFLCYGNICRSAFAAAYWNRRTAELRLGGPRATSAGFYPVSGRPVPPRFLALARAHGVELAGHRSRAVDAGELEGADAIFVMDRDNAQALARRHPEVLERTFLLGGFARGAGAAEAPEEIGDPYGLDPGGASERYRQLVAALEGLLRRVEGAAAP